MWDVGTVLGRAMDILKENVGIVLLGFVVAFTANFFVQMPASVMEPGLPVVLSQTDSELAPVVIGVFAVLQAFLGLLAFLVRVYFGLGLCRLLLHVVRGEEASLSDFVTSTSQYACGLGASFLVTMGVTIGFVACIFPGVYLMLCLFMWEYILVDQDVGPIQAIQESWRLTEGERLQLLVFGIVSVCLNVVGILFCGIGLILTVPLTCLAVALIYEDMVQRKGTMASPVAG